MYLFTLYLTITFLAPPLTAIFIIALSLDYSLFFLTQFTRQLKKELLRLHFDMHKYSENDNITKEKF